MCSQAKVESWRMIFLNQELSNECETQKIKIWCCGKNSGKLQEPEIFNQV